MQEKRKKITQREKFSILHYMLNKNASWSRFFWRFGTFEVTKTQTQRIV